MFSREQIEREIYRRYIEPTEIKRKTSVGVEFELPIVNLSKEAVDFETVHRMMDAFTKRFSFGHFKYDDEGHVYSALEDSTGDDISFDCSYNTVEFSFGKEENLLLIRDRFVRYYQFLSDFLGEYHHAVTGMGLNPHYQYNRAVPVPNGRYRMLLHHLGSYTKYEGQMLFHNTPYYGLIACSAQTHLNADKARLPEMINIFNKLEPLKALLFSNSPAMQPDGMYMCVRDHLWRESMHGLNPHNVDGWNIELHGVDEIAAYIRSMSLYCTERDGKYINFTPTPLEEYFAKEEMTGEYYDGTGYSLISWTPELSDLEYLRSFKFVDLTFRGTIELRSACMQPVREAMGVPAFHLGLYMRLHELDELLQRSDLYLQGYTPVELRKLFVRRNLPAFVRQEELRELLKNVVALAADGLKERGNGEEVLIQSLERRAEEMECPALEMVRGLGEGRTIDDYIREFGTL